MKTQITAARAMYGPYGKRDDHSRRRAKMRLTPTTDPIIELSINEKITAFHPRHAPMAAMNLTSPSPIASRGSTISAPSRSKRSSR